MKLRAIKFSLILICLSFILLEKQNLYSQNQESQYKLINLVKSNDYNMIENFIQENDPYSITNHESYYNPMISAYSRTHTKIYNSIKEI